MKILFCIIGTYIGFIIGDWSNEEEVGAGLGFFIGWIAGAVIQQNKRLKSLEAKLKLIQSNLIDSRVDVRSTESVVSDNLEQGAVDDVPMVEGVTEDIAYPHSTSDISEKITQDDYPQTENTERSNDWHKAPDMPGTPDIADKTVNWIRDFFTKGNVVVKVGVIVLFFGVSFLLKYAAGKHVIPVEFWFIVVAVGIIALLIFGWRLRLKNAAYALVIQGGAVGMLYITVFSAAKLFTLMPLGLTFFLMFALVVFSCILAVLQDSKSLALFATVGGFWRLY